MSLQSIPSSRPVVMIAVGTALLAREATAQVRIEYIESTISGEAFGHTSVGPDLDGDGVFDLLISAPVGSCSIGFEGYAITHGFGGSELDRWCGSSIGSAFGASAWIGDVDGGGVADLAIGERDYDDPVKYGRNAGRVQVYSSETGALLYEKIGTQTDARLGVPVAACDDLDLDGVTDFLVAGVGYGSNGDGRVLVVSSVTGKTIRSHSGAFQADLGYRICALRDVDGDGVGDYALSADQPTSGRVHVYSGLSGTKLRHFDSSTGGGDAFGSAVAAPGDLDGDGLADILISGGEPLLAGRVEAYSVASGALLWSIAGAGSGTKIGEWYGQYTCAVGDINQDGFEDFMIAAGWDDHDGKDAGRVDLVSGRFLRPLYRFYPGIDGITEYGHALTRGVDFNGDGFEDLVIGTPYGGTTEAEGGHVGIYAGNDLFLQADPLSPTSAETVTVDLRGAEPFKLGMIALVAVDGVPVFESLHLTAFDADAEIQLLADTDPSVSGHDFTILGYAQNRAGRGPLMVSNPQTVSVQ